MTTEQAMVTNKGGIGMGMVLFLIFMVLKLTDLIDWSWWWVTAPLWIPTGLMLGIAVIGAVIGLYEVWMARK